MATYAIGDIHGCFTTLTRLLERISYNPKSDRLWLTGDLVNRGPHSLEVLRWAHANQERVSAVLGNHDVHLLARASGAPGKRWDALDDVLDAPDKGALLAWLHARPLILRGPEALMVHAGLHPSWGLDEALDLAHEVSDFLQRTGGLEALHARRKVKWRSDLEGCDRLAAALGIFTRVRVVRPDGRPKLSFTGPPEDAPKDCRPWFDGARALADGLTVLFGHWATLGHSRRGTVVCLDSGCCWGRGLTAVRLQDQTSYFEPLADGDRGPASELWGENRA